MKRMLTMIALAAFALSFTACTPNENTAAQKTAAAATPEVAALMAAKESAADIEKALLQMERDWMEAFKNRDKAALESILADDFVSISWEGKTFDKAESIAVSTDASNKLDSYTLTPLKVRIYGETAVVTGGDIEKGSYQGKDTSGQYAWTDVYAKRNGRWQAVSSHSSRFPTAKK